MSESSFVLYVQCSLGLEKTLQAELEGLGYSADCLEGGVELRGTLQDLWKLCLSSRVAESVRLRLKAFVAKDFEGLKKELRKLPFRAFLNQGTPVEVKVVCHKSRLWHSAAVAERAMEVLTEYVGCVSAEGAPGGVQRVHIRVTDDKVRVSLDASGARLHRRGYREHVARASLRETLAAALFLGAHAGENQGACLWDPFCGAGTIPLEWAHRAVGRIPGEGKRFAFEAWRTHEADKFSQFREKCVVDAHAAALYPEPRLLAIGSDISKQAITAARHNRALAGLTESLELIEGDVLSVSEKIPHGAFVVTNPPYGKRLQDCSALTKLLSVLKQRTDLRPAAILVGGAARSLIPASCPSVLQFKNGGLSVSARLFQ